MIGRQVGRVVGVLQGARARADRFTADNELRQLQNELRSSLRELDTVRGELAVAASGSGLMGRGLGSMVPGANRIGTGVSSMKRETSISAPASSPSTAPDISSGSAMASVSPSGHDYLAAARSAEANASTSCAGLGEIVPTNPLGLAPRSQSVAAVAEEEWAKQGIGFVSRAERGTGAWEGMMGSGSDGGGKEGNNASGQATAGGAVLLADVIQQSLIYDQHDRAVREQEEALAQRADRIQKERLQQKRHSGNTEREDGDR
jgi:hypothetical protein